MAQAVMFVRQQLPRMCLCRSGMLHQSVGVLLSEEIEALRRNSSRN